MSLVVISADKYNLLMLKAWIDEPVTTSLETLQTYVKVKGFFEY